MTSKSPLQTPAQVHLSWLVTRAQITIAVYTATWLNGKFQFLAQSKILNAVSMLKLSVTNIDAQFRLLTRLGSTGSSVFRTFSKTLVSSS